MVKVMLTNASGYSVCMACDLHYSLEVFVYNE